jgi:hypothetical protein
MSNIQIFCEYTKEMPTSELQVHEKSPYIHNEDQIIALTKIIENNGWRNSIVVTSRDCKTIIKGRLLYETALYNDWDKVPVEIQEYDTDEAEIADMISDNRVTSMSEMDDFILAEVIEKIDDLGGNIENTGYNEKMLGQFLNNMDDMIIGGEKEFEIQDEESIKTIKLIFDSDDFITFKTLMSEICEKKKDVPSNVIYQLAEKAFDYENKEC